MHVPPVNMNDLGLRVTRFLATRRHEEVQSSGKDRHCLVKKKKVEKPQPLKVMHGHKSVNLSNI